jgi:predicted short-subunit dehydrogenase-like oxidoreductase (DUF2520 family)
VPDLDGLRLIVVGPGRAGGSVARAAREAGHEIVGVLSRSGTDEYGPPLSWGQPLPDADLALIAVKDEAVNEVAGCLSGLMAGVPVAAHLSGFLPVTALSALAEDGVAIGGFHPLQTLPDPVRGSAALAGSFVAIGGDPLAVDTLRVLAVGLGMEPFEIDDAARPAYHAAAAASANFVVTALAVAGDLLESAHIDLAVMRPLVERVVANVFEGGPGRALTGPIARGDIETVIGHLTAAREVSEPVGRQFGLMAEATAIRAGREEDLKRWK